MHYAELFHRFEVEWPVSIYIYTPRFVVSALLVYRIQSLMIYFRIFQYRVFSVAVWLSGLAVLLA